MLWAYGLAVEIDFDVPALSGNDGGFAGHGPVLRATLASDAEIDSSWSGEDDADRRAEAVVDGVPWVVRRGRDGDMLMDHGELRFHLDPAAEVISCAPGERDQASWHRVFLDSALVTVSLVRGFEALHAAVARRRDLNVALLGGSGAGKSTLLARLLSRGWTLVTDDVAALAYEAGGVVAMPGPPLATLPAGAAVGAGGRVVTELGTEVWVHFDEVAGVPATLDAIIETDRSPDGPAVASIHEVRDPAQCILSHALHTGADPDRRRRRFEQIGALADSARCMRLIADLDATPDELTDLIEAQLETVC